MILDRISIDESIFLVIYFVCKIALLISLVIRVTKPHITKNIATKKSYFVGRGNISFFSKICIVHT